MLLNKGKISHFLRAISVFILICFTTTSVAWGTPTLSLEPRALSPELKTEQLASKITIPAEIGSIKEVYVSQTGFDSALVVNLEEAHGQAEGQKNIEKILTHLKTKYGLNTVFLEGTWGKLDPANLRFFEDPKLNRELLEDLNQKSLIGGVELFLSEQTTDHSPQSIANKSQGKDHGLSTVDRELRPKAYGVEDVALYRENLEQFRKVYAAKPRTDAFLKGLRQKITDGSARTFNPELKRFFKDWAFRNEIAAQPFAGIEQLRDSASKYLSLDLSDAREQYDWPQLVRFFKLKKIEQAAYNGQRITYSEKEKLTQWLKKQGLEDFKSLFDVYDSKPSTLLAQRYGDPRTQIEKFYELAAPKGFKFEDYPNLTRQIGIAILSSELQAPDLFREVEKLNDLILDKLAVKPEEKKLIAEYKDYVLLKKLFALELSRGEYEELSRRPQTTDHRLQTKAFGLQSPVSSLMSAALEFYKTAAKRESAIFMNMLVQMKAQRGPNVVLVTGGFHSEGLSEFFKKNGCSYVRISPRITKSQSPAAYLSLMTGKQQKGTVLLEALKGPSPSQKPDPLKQKTETIPFNELRPASLILGFSILRRDLGAPTADLCRAELRSSIEKFSRPSNTGEPRPALQAGSRMKVPVNELIARRLSVKTAPGLAQNVPGPRKDRISTKGETPQRPGLYKGVGMVQSDLPVKQDGSRKVRAETRENKDPGDFQAAIAYLDLMIRALRALNEKPAPEKKLIGPKVKRIGDGSQNKIAPAQKPAPQDFQAFDAAARWIFGLKEENTEGTSKVRSDNMDRGSPKIKTARKGGAPMKPGLGAGVNVARSKDRSETRLVTPGVNTARAESRGASLMDDLRLIRHDLVNYLDPLNQTILLMRKPTPEDPSLKFLETLQLKCRAFIDALHKRGNAEAEYGKIKNAAAEFVKLLTEENIRVLAEKSPYNSLTKTPAEHGRLIKIFEEYFHVMKLLLEEMFDVPASQRYGIKRLLDMTRNYVSFRHDTKNHVDKKTDARLEAADDYAGDIPDPRIPEGKLMRVLVNLADNAWRQIAKKQKRFFEVRAFPEGGELVIQLTDNGPGMPSEKMDIFNNTSEAVPSEKGPRSGLGLQVVRSVISEFGGTVSVASEPGKGATFTLRLPLRSEARDLEKNGQNGYKKITARGLRKLFEEDFKKKKEPTEKNKFIRWFQEQFAGGDGRLIAEFLVNSLEESIETTEEFLADILAEILKERKMLGEKKERPGQKKYQPDVYLASKSVNRHKLMEWIFTGKPIIQTTLPEEFEPKPESGSPLNRVAVIALAKTIRSFLYHLDPAGNELTVDRNRDYLWVGGDTLMFMESDPGNSIGKPSNLKLAATDEEKVAMMHERIKGRTLDAVSSGVFIKAGSGSVQVRIFSDKARVILRNPLDVYDDKTQEGEKEQTYVKKVLPGFFEQQGSEKTVSDYWKAYQKTDHKHEDQAGGFGIQEEEFFPLLDRVDGDPYVVMGFPVRVAGAYFRGEDLSGLEVPLEDKQWGSEYQLRKIHAAGKSWSEEYRRIKEEDARLDFVRKIFKEIKKQPRLAACRFLELRDAESGTDHTALPSLYVDLLAYYLSESQQEGERILQWMVRFARTRKHLKAERENLVKNRIEFVTTSPFKYGMFRDFLEKSGQKDFEIKREQKPLNRYFEESSRLSFLGERRPKAMMMAISFEKLWESLVEDSQSDLTAQFSVVGESRMFLSKSGKPGENHFLTPPKNAAEEENLIQRVYDQEVEASSVIGVADQRTGKVRFGFDLALIKMRPSSDKLDENERILFEEQFAKDDEQNAQGEAPQTETKREIFKKLFRQEPVTVGDVRNYFRGKGLERAAGMVLQEPLFFAAVESLYGDPFSAMAFPWQSTVNIFNQFGLLKSFPKDRRSQTAIFDELLREKIKTPLREKIAYIPSLQLEDALKKKNVYALTRQEILREIERLPKVIKENPVHLATLEEDPRFKRIDIWIRAMCISIQMVEFLEAVKYAHRILDAYGDFIANVITTMEAAEEKADSDQKKSGLQEKIAYWKAFQKALHYIAKIYPAKNVEKWKLSKTASTIELLGERTEPFPSPLWNKNVARLAHQSELFRRLDDVANLWNQWAPAKVKARRAFTLSLGDLLAEEKPDHPSGEGLFLKDPAKAFYKKDQDAAEKLLRMHSGLRKLAEDTQQVFRERFAPTLLGDNPATWRAYSELFINMVQSDFNEDFPLRPMTQLHESTLISDDRSEWQKKMQEALREAKTKNKSVSAAVYFNNAGMESWMNLWQVFLLLKLGFEVTIVVPEAPILNKDVTRDDILFMLPYMDALIHTIYPEEWAKDFLIKAFEKGEPRGWETGSEDLTAQTLKIQTVRIDSRSDKLLNPQELKTSSFPKRVEEDLEAAERDPFDYPEAIRRNLVKLIRKHHFNILTGELWYGYFVGMGELNAAPLNAVSELHQDSEASGRRHAKASLKSENESRYIGGEKDLKQGFGLGSGINQAKRKLKEGISEPDNLLSGEIDFGKGHVLTVHVHKNVRQPLDTWVNAGEHGRDQGGLPDSAVTYGSFDVHYFYPKSWRVIEKDFYYKSGSSIEDIILDGKFFGEMLEKFGDAGKFFFGSAEDRMLVRVYDVTAEVSAAAQAKGAIDVREAYDLIYRTPTRGIRIRVMAYKGMYPVRILHSNEPEWVNGKIEVEFGVNFEHLLRVSEEQGGNSLDEASDDLATRLDAVPNLQSKIPALFRGHLRSAFEAHLHQSKRSSASVSEGFEIINPKAHYTLQKSTLQSDEVEIYNGSNAIFLKIPIEAAPPRGLQVSKINRLIQDAAHRKKPLLFRAQIVKYGTHGGMGHLYQYVPCWLEKNLEDQWTLNLSIPNLAQRTDILSIFSISEELGGKSIQPLSDSSFRIVLYRNEQAKRLKAAEDPLEVMRKQIASGRFWFQKAIDRGKTAGSKDVLPRVTLAPVDFRTQADGRLAAHQAAGKKNPVLAYSDLVRIGHIFDFQDNIDWWEYFDFTSGLSRLDISEEEGLSVIQLAGPHDLTIGNEVFGGENISADKRKKHIKEAFRKAAFLAVKNGAKALNINMGSPSLRMQSKGGGRISGGAALIDMPEFAAEIVQAIRQGAHEALDMSQEELKGFRFPVSVKTRLAQESVTEKDGKTKWVYDALQTEKFLHAMVEAGASWIDVHTRTADQQYAAQTEIPNNRDHLRKVLRNLKGKGVALPPFFANGNINTPRDVDAVLKNQDDFYGVMIGRLVTNSKNPLLLKAVAEYVRTGRISPADIPERIQTLLRSLRNAQERLGDKFFWEDNIRSPFSSLFGSLFLKPVTNEDFASNQSSPTLKDALSRAGVPEQLKEYQEQLSVSPGYKEALRIVKRVKEYLSAVIQGRLPEAGFDDPNRSKQLKAPEIPKDGDEFLEILKAEGFFPAGSDNEELRKRIVEEFLDPPADDRADPDLLSRLVLPEHISGAYLNGDVKNRPEWGWTRDFQMEFFRREMQKAIKARLFRGHPVGAQEHFARLWDAFMKFEDTKGHVYYDSLTNVQNNRASVRLCRYVLFGKPDFDDEKEMRKVAGLANATARGGLRNSRFTQILAELEKAKSPVEKAGCLYQALQMALFVAAPNIWFSSPEAQADPEKTADRIKELIPKALEVPLALDSTAEFIQEVLIPKAGGSYTKAVYFVDDNGDLIYHLYLIQSYLRINPKLRIALVAKSERVAIDSTLNDLLHELEQPEFLFLRQMTGTRLQVIKRGPVYGGVNLRNASDELVRAVLDSDLVIGLGQMVTETMNGILRPAYHQAYVDSRFHQRATGLPKGSLYFTRVPAGKKYLDHYADDARLVTLKDVRAEMRSGDAASEPRRDESGNFIKNQLISDRFSILKDNLSHAAENIFKVLASGKLPAVFPYQIQFDLTHFCPFWDTIQKTGKGLKDCMNCAFPEKTRKQVVSKALVGLLKQFETGGGRSVFFTGGGEPGVYDSWHDLFVFFAGSTLGMTLNTNGLFVRKLFKEDPEILRKVFSKEKDPSVVSFSVHGDYAYKLVKQLDQLRKKLGLNIVIRNTFLIHGDTTVAEMETFIKNSEHAGADIVAFKPEHISKEGARIFSTNEAAGRFINDLLNKQAAINKGNPAAGHPYKLTIAAMRTDRLFESYREVRELYKQRVKADLDPLCLAPLCNLYLNIDFLAAMCCDTKDRGLGNTKPELFGDGPTLLARPQDYFLAAMVGIVKLDPKNCLLGCNFWEANESYPLKFGLDFLVNTLKKLRTAYRLGRITEAEVIEKLKASFADERKTNLRSESRSERIAATISKEELNGLKISGVDILAALSELPAVNDMARSYGFTALGQSDQLELIGAYLEKIVKEKQKTGDRQLTIFEIGIGEKPREMIQILESLERVALKTKMDLGRWRIGLIAIDKFTRQLRSAKSDENVKVLLKRLQGAVTVTFREGDALDLQSLRNISVRKKGDLIFFRNTDYSSLLFAVDQVNLEAVRSGDLSKLPWVLNSYLSKRNIFSAFGKEGSLYVVDPVFGPSPNDGKEAEVLFIPGASPVTVMELKPWSELPVTSLENRGTGMYRIEDPAAIHQAGISRFAGSGNLRRAELFPENRADLLVKQAGRAEVRAGAHQLSESTARTLADAENRLNQLFKEARILVRSAEGLDKGILYPTPAKVVRDIFLAMEIPEDGNVTLLDAGSGQGPMLLRFAMARPDIKKLVGIEYDLSAVEESRRLIDLAVAKGWVREGQIQIFHGDFNDREFSGYFETADRVYYFQPGTVHQDELVRTLSQHLKSGAKVVVYPSQINAYREIQLAKTGLFEIKHAAGVSVFTRLSGIPTDQIEDSGPRSEAMSQPQQLSAQPADAAETVDISVRPSDWINSILAGIMLPVLLFFRFCAPAQFPGEPIDGKEPQNIEQLSPTNTPPANAPSLQKRSETRQDPTSFVAASDGQRDQKIQFLAAVLPAYLNIPGLLRLGVSVKRAVYDPGQKPAYEEAFKIRFKNTDSDEDEGKIILTVFHKKKTIPVNFDEHSRNPIKVMITSIYPHLPRLQGLGKTLLWLLLARETAWQGEYAVIKNAQRDSQAMMQSMPELLVPGVNWPDIEFRIPVLNPEQRRAVAVIFEKYIKVISKNRAEMRASKKAGKKIMALQKLLDELYAVPLPVEGAQLWHCINGDLVEMSYAISYDSIPKKQDRIKWFARVLDRFERELAVLLMPEVERKTRMQQLVSSYKNMAKARAAGKTEEFDFAVLITRGLIVSEPMRAVLEKWRRIIEKHRQQDDWPIKPNVSDRRSEARDESDHRPKTEANSKNSSQLRAVAANLGAAGLPGLGSPISYMIYGNARRSETRQPETPPAGTVDGQRAEEIGNMVRELHDLRHDLGNMTFGFRNACMIYERYHCLNDEINKVLGFIKESEKVLDALDELPKEPTHEEIDAYRQRLLMIALDSQKTIDGHRLSASFEEAFDKLPQDYQRSPVDRYYKHHANKLLYTTLAVGWAINFKNAVADIFPELRLGHTKVNIRTALYAALSLHGNTFANGRIIDNTNDVDILADEVALNRVLSNILTNASDAISESGKGEVVVSADLKDGGKWLEIKVSDTANGIKPEILPRIFERGVTTKLGKNRGRGLAIAKEYVDKRLGGTISVESRHIAEHPNDYGTIFTIRLPIRSSNDMAAQEGKAVRSEEREKKIAESWKLEEIANRVFATSHSEVKRNIRWVWQEYGIDGMEIPQSLIDKIVAVYEKYYREGRSVPNNMAWLTAWIACGSMNEFVMKTFQKEGVVLTPDEERFLWKMWYARKGTEESRSLEDVYAPSYFIDELKKIVKKRQAQTLVKVLELGSGPKGTAIRELAEKVREEGLGGKVEFHGVDLIAADKTIDAVHLHGGDVRNLLFADASVDFIFEHKVLMYFDQDRKAFENVIREVMRVLRPGGKFVIINSSSMYVEHQKKIAGLLKEMGIPFETEGSLIVIAKPRTETTRSEMRVAVKLEDEHEAMMDWLTKELPQAVDPALIKNATLIHADTHPDTFTGYSPHINSPGNVILRIHERDLVKKIWWAFFKLEMWTAEMHDLSVFEALKGLGPIMPVDDVSPLTPVEGPVILSIDFDLFADVSDQYLSQQEVEWRIRRFLTLLKKNRYQVIGIFFAKSPRHTQETYTQQIEQKLKEGLCELYLLKEIPIARAEMRSLSKLLHERFPKRSEISFIDLDTGMGAFLPAFRKFLETQGYSVKRSLGTELFKNIIARAKPAVRSGIVHANAQFSGDFAQFPPHSFDIVTINNIESAPWALAARAKELLKSQGLLLVTVEENDASEGRDDTIIFELKRAGFEVARSPLPPDYPSYETLFKSTKLLVATLPESRSDLPSQRSEGRSPNIEDESPTQNMTDPSSNLADVQSNVAEIRPALQAKTRDSDAQEHFASSVGYRLPTQEEIDELDSEDLGDSNPPYTTFAKYYRATELQRRVNSRLMARHELPGSVRIYFQGTVMDENIRTSLIDKFGWDEMMTRASLIILNGKIVADHGKVLDEAAVMRFLKNGDVVTALHDSVVEEHIREYAFVDKDVPFHIAPNVADIIRILAERFPEKVSADLLGLAALLKDPRKHEKRGDFFYVIPWKWPKVFKAASDTKGASSDRRSEMREQTRPKTKDQRLQTEEQFLDSGLKSQASSLETRPEVHGINTSNAVEPEGLIAYKLYDKTNNEMQLATTVMKFSAAEKDVAQAVAERVLRVGKVKGFGREAWRRFWGEWVPDAYAEQTVDQRLVTRDQKLQSLVSSLMSKVKNAPFRVSVIFKGKPLLNKPVIQLLTEVLIHKPAMQIQIVMPNDASLEDKVLSPEQILKAHASKLRTFERELTRKVLAERRKLGIVEKGVNLIVTSESAKVPDFLKTSQERALVYDMRKNGRAELEGLAPKIGKSEALLVFDNTELSQKAYALLAALDRLFDQNTLPQGVQSAASLLASNLQIAAAAAQSLSSAA